MITYTLVRRTFTITLVITAIVMFAPTAVRRFLPFCFLTVVFYALLSLDSSARTTSPIRSLQGRPSRRLLFRSNLFQTGKDRQWITRASLNWAQPRKGVVPALRHLVKLLTVPEDGLSDVDRFWREFYEKTLFNELLPNGSRGLQEHVDSLIDGDEEAIVMTGGSSTFARVVFLLRSMRLLECPQIPTKVYYCERDPFDSRQIAFLETQFGVRVISINSLFPPAITPEIRPGTLSLYATLATRARRTITMTPDIILFQCPTITRANTLLFKDRLLHPNNDAMLNFILGTILPQPLSSQMASSQIIRQQSSFQHDSALVFFERKDPCHAIALLAAIRLSQTPVRENWAGAFGSGNDDKEAWWMGLEATGCTEWQWEQPAPGSAGFLYEQEGRPAVCGGKLVHFSSNGLPWWASGGIDRDGTVERLTVMSDGHGKWTLGLCQVADHPIIELNEGEMGVRVRQLESLYHPDPLVQ